MKNVLMILLVLAVYFFKFTAIGFIIYYGATFYDSNLPIHTQHPLVWILLYIPIFWGYESIIATIWGYFKSDGK